MNLEKKVLEYKEDVIKSIQEAIRIKSVMESPKENKPFGEGPARALEYFYNLGKKLGFTVKNYDNYAIEIEFNDGDEMLGILGHVDVVPEGDGWTYPPYAGEIVDGKIYGRGTLDDKGPSVICLYAMKAIMDSGVKLNKKVRMILGANEENGSACMKHYFGVLNRPQPDLAFTPDSTFPVTFAEKGGIRIVLKNSYLTLKNYKLTGGNALNSVPEETELTIPKADIDEFKNVLEEYNNSSSYKIQIFDDNECYKFISYGKSAHGSKPSLGYNSVCALFMFLNKCKINNTELKKIVDFFSKFIKMELDGESLGIKMSDDVSGELTVNLGKISLIDGNLEIGLDIRCPVLTPNEKVIDIVKEKVGKYMTVNVTGNSAPLHIDRESFLVKSLMDVYKKVTGDYESEPIAIGGGTYARTITNGVAFGALLSSQVDNMHQKDEYLEIDKIDTLLKIYVEAIYQLAK